MPKTYQLYLATEITSPTSNLIVPIDKSNKANVTWQVDFKSLFGDDIYKFKRCTLRGHFLSQSITTTDTVFDVKGGFLAINLPTTYSSSTSTSGTPVMLIYPSQAPYSTTNIVAYNCSTLGNVQGVDIPMPSGNQFLNIRLMNSDSSSIQTTAPDYQLILQFELLDEVV